VDEFIQYRNTHHLILRFKNCTGNVIDFSEMNMNRDMSELELAEEQVKVQAALSIDPEFKNKRRRTIAQALMMTLRQRTISQGFYDYQIARYVYPITLE